MKNTEWFLAELDSEAAKSRRVLEQAPSGKGDFKPHERSMEFRMQEVELVDGSPLVGRSLRELRLRERAKVLVLALRLPDGTFVTNPDPTSPLAPKQVIIAVGTADALDGLEELTR